MNSKRIIQGLFIELLTFIIKAQLKKIFKVKVFSVWFFDLAWVGLIFGFLGLVWLDLGQSLQAPWAPWSGLLGPLGPFLTELAQQSWTTLKFRC